MTAPFVSVVVCAHNEQGMLGACLESLEAQSLPRDRYEIIVVDDGSTDATGDVARQFVRGGARPSRKYVRIDRGGLSVARSTGVSRSRGGIIAFIDADAIADSHWLQRMLDAFSDPSVGIVGGFVENLETSRVSALLYTGYYREYLRKVELKLIGANMAFLASAFERTAGFFSFFDRRGDEVSFAIAYARESGKRIAHAPEAVVRHKHPDQIPEWLATQTYNGAMVYVIDASVGPGVAAANLGAIIRATALAALFVLPVGALMGASWPWLLLLAVLPATRAGLGVRRTGSGVAAVAARFGALIAIVWAFLTLARVFFFDLGYVKQAMRMRFGAGLPELRAEIGTITLETTSDAQPAEIA